VPLDLGDRGGSFLYHYDDNLVAVGFCIHLNYDNPYHTAHLTSLQRFKTPSISFRGPLFDGAKRLRLLRRARYTEGATSRSRGDLKGGAPSSAVAPASSNGPRSRVFTTRWAQACSVTRRLAAFHLLAGRANDEIVDYENGWSRQRRRQGLFTGRNVKPLWSRSSVRARVGLPGGFFRHLDEQLFGFFSRCSAGRFT